MHRNLCFLSILVVCGRATLGRDIKPLRSIPSITNSLVNLGKMDISFHISSPYRSNHGLTSKSKFVHSVSPFIIPKGESQMQLESCPCSSFNNLKTTSPSNPADMINKILRSNDLFEPLVSSMCCDSHEHEESIFFELTPKTNYESLSPLPSFNLANALIQQGAMPTFSQLPENLQPKPASSLTQPDAMPSIPLLLENIHSIYPLATQPGSKDVEIFFFPKNKAGRIDFTKLSPNMIINPLDKKAAMTPVDKKAKMTPTQKNFNKNKIQIVGHKRLRNNFERNMVKSSIPITQIKDAQSNQISFDNELEKARQEKKEIKELNDIKEKEMDNELGMKEKETKIGGEKDQVETFTPVATSGPPDVL